MNWVRLKLLFNNAQIVAIFGSYGALVGLPALLRYSSEQDFTITYTMPWLEFSLGFGALLAIQTWLLLIAVSAYLAASVVTTMTIPASIATHNHLSDYVKNKKDSSNGSPSDKATSMSLSAGEHWAEDLVWNAPLRVVLTALILVALASFALSFLCSFSLLRAALLR